MVPFGVDPAWGIVVTQLAGNKSYRNKKVGGASADIKDVRDLFKARTALLFLFEDEGLIFFLRKINLLGEISS